MRFISYILATYIFLLTVSPVEAGVRRVLMVQQTEADCGGSCCSYQQEDSRQKNEAGKQTPKDCCSDGICNSCEQCVWCTGIVIKQLSCQLINIAVPNEFCLPNPINITSDYSAGCFHPPETV